MSHFETRYQFLKIHPYVIEFWYHELSDNTTRVTDTR